MIDAEASRARGIVSPAVTVRGVVARALGGHATLLILLAEDVADATAALQSMVLPVFDGAEESVTRATGLVWEKDRPGAVLERLRLDADDVLLGLGGDARVLVVTEAGDADAESLQALSSAVHRLGDEPVLVVVTASVADIQVGTLADLARAHRDTTVRLDRLDGAGVQSLAATVGVSLGDHTARRLARHTDGSSAAILELLDGHDVKQWTSPDTPLPPTLGSLREVADALREAPEIRPLVEACAVIGRWCTLEDAGRVAEIDEVGELLDRGVELGILASRRVNLRVMMGFRSRLLRAAAYETMGLSRQRRLHRRAGEVLADPGARLLQRALASGEPAPELAAELDRWASVCADDGVWEQAAAAWLAASRVSAGRDEATKRLIRCLDATVSDGKLYEARAVMAEVQLTEPIPERDAVLGYYQLLLGHRDEADLLLKQAWDRATDRDQVTRSFIAHRLALHSLVDWDTAGLVYWGELALELADGALPSVPAGFEAHSMLGLGLGGEGRIEEAESTYSRLTSAVNGGAQGQRALMGQGWLHQALSRSALAAHELELAAPLDVWRGSTRVSLWANAWLAHARIALGDLAAARDAVDRALPLLEETGQNIALPLVHWAGAQIATLRGEDQIAERHAALASSVRTDYQGMLVAAVMARACVAIGQGDYAGTVRACEPLIQLDRHGGIDEPGFWPWQDLYGIALVAIGEFDEADRFLRPHEERAAARNHRTTMARLGTARGRLQFVTGDIAAGRETFERSLALISELPQPMLRSRIHLGYGQALRRVGKRRDADTQLRHARRGYVAMGATGYVTRCDRELKAGTRSRGQASLVELTAQEQAVVDLVVTGMTNREVAESLFISVKTVQYHLTRVYARLGIRSRSELTALWHEN